MSANFKGTTDIQEQAPRRQWSKDQGWSTVRTWEGEKIAIQNFATTLISSGAEGINIDPDGPIATVSGTFPDAQDVDLSFNQGALNVEWQLLGNDLEKSLRTHSGLEPTSDSERADLNAAEKAVRDATEKLGTWGVKGSALYDLLSKGVEAYVVTQYVVRKTIKVARGSDVKAALNAVNRVEPPPFNDSILKVFDLPEDTGDLLGVEWLKKPPTVTALGRGKFAIDQEWWGARKWSQGLYGGTAIP